MRLRVIVIAILVLVVAGGVAIVLLRKPIAQRIEGWARTQLQAIANDHLGPTLSFDALDYEFPRSVTLSTVRVTADDVPFIEADSVRIDLAEIPRVGRPIVIESVTLESPVVRLIRRAEGSLVGFKGFVKTDGGRELPDGGSTRLRDVLAIQRIDVRNGTFQYEKPGAPVMRLRPLTFELRYVGAATGEGRASVVGEDGWYRFRSAMRLEPVARLDLEGRLNLATAEFDFQKADLRTTLRSDQYHVFTPEIQTILREHEIVGDLHWRLSGRIPLRDAAGSNLESSVTLRNASVAFGEYVMPLKLLDIDARLSGGRLEIRRATAQGFGGQASASGHVRFDDPLRPFELTGHGQGLRLQDALRYRGDKEPQVAGEFTFEVVTQGRFASLADTFTGSGRFDVAKGRLVTVQLFRDLLGLTGTRRDTDQSSARFALSGDRVRFSDVKVSGDLIGFTGEGDLHYDGRLDFVFHGGPLKGKDGVLGAVGDTLGLLTDRLATYDLKGTVQEPKLSVRPLGIER